MNVFIDESLLPDSTTYMYCAIAIADKRLVGYRSTITSTREDIVKDPLYAQFMDTKTLNKKKSFHYTEDHREIKNRMFALLTQMAYEAFLHIYYNVNKSDIKESRIKYIKSLNLFLSKKYREPLYFVWEKDESLHKINWPQDIFIDEKYKGEEELLSISDYVLGTFRKIYLKEYNDTPKTTCIRDYEFIKNKIRFIKDSRIKKPYTRRNLYIVE